MSCKPQTYATMNDLSPELIHEILSHNHQSYPATLVPLHNDQLAARAIPQVNLKALATLKKWLRNVSSLNQAWYTASLPLLYSICFLSTDPRYREATLHRLKQIKNYGRFVRHLVVNFTESRSSFESNSELEDGVTSKSESTSTKVDLFDDFGKHLPGCIVIDVTIQRSTRETDPDLRVIHNLFASFDSPNTLVRSIRIGSVRQLSQGSIVGILTSIPEVVSSQLEVLDISGWNIQSTLPQLDSGSNGIQAKFPRIQHLSLDHIDTSKSTKGKGLTPPFSLISHSSSSTSLTSFSISNTVVYSTSIISVLSTPIPSPILAETTSPYASESPLPDIDSTISNTSILGNQITHIHMDILYPMIHYNDHIDIMTAPFLLTSLCPNLIVLGYFTLTPTAFLLPSNTDRLSITQTLLDLDMVDGALPRLTKLRELGVRVMSDAWGDILLAGKRGVDRAIEWAKDERLRGGALRRLVVHCECLDNFEGEAERVRSELGLDLGGGVAGRLDNDGEEREEGVGCSGLEIEMVQREKMDKSRIGAMDGFELKWLIKDL